MNNVRKKNWNINPSSCGKKSGEKVESKLRMLYCAMFWTVDNDLTFKRCRLLIGCQTWLPSVLCSAGHRGLCSLLVCSLILNPGMAQLLYLFALEEFINCLHVQLVLCSHKTYNMYQNVIIDDCFSVCWKYDSVSFAKFFSLLYSELL